MIKLNLWGRLELLRACEAGYKEKDRELKEKGEELSVRFIWWLYLLKIQVAIWLDWQKPSSPTDEVMKIAELKILNPPHTNFYERDFIYTPLSLWEWNYDIWSVPVVFM